MESNGQLLLEVGKTYVSEDGRRFFVGYKRAEKCDFPFVGHLLNSEYSETWQLNGKSGRTKALENDLVAEWVEPKRVKGWLAIAENLSKLDPVVAGQFFCATLTIWPNRQDAINTATGKVVACVEIDVLEGEGLEGVGR